MLPFWIQKHKTGVAEWHHALLSERETAGFSRFVVKICYAGDTCEGECHKVTGVCRLQRANNPPMKSERSDADGKENRTWQRAGQPVFIK